MDDRRFVVVVSPYIRDMIHVAIALIGATDAEDVVQDALLRAWRAASSLREGDTVRAWLLRITANVCHDWRRGRYGAWVRLTTPFPGSFDEGSALPASAEADPGSSVATTRLDIRRMVDLLEEDLRVVVVLRYYAEMNATEIGAALDLPASTIRTRLQRALTHLRASVDPGEKGLHAREDS